MTDPVPALPRYQAIRYVQPLREGGSLPAVVDTDDGLYVVKFRGAGQGAKALVAELIVGMLAGALELPVPDLALLEVPPPFGRSEPDPEIQDVLRRSHGLNVGLRYLDGAFNFDGRAAGEFISPEVAAGIVWLDGFTTNPDRTHRNPNLLIWRRRPWLIDHGAALYAHHDWASVDAARTATPFQLIRDHVLLLEADRVGDFDRRAAAHLTEGLLRRVLDAVPDELLAGDEFPDAIAARTRYVTYLVDRLRDPRPFVAEARAAREHRLTSPRRALEARR